MTDLTRSDILEHALRIHRKYEAQDIALSLRQVYYRFVDEGLLPSGQNVYKRIGDVLTEARYNGDFPVTGIQDRGRDVEAGDFTRYDIDIDPGERIAASSLRAARFYINRARWLEQETHISVWVEKAALESVFAPTCEELGVSFFACRGYPSVSSLWEWIETTNKAIGYADGSPTNAWEEGHEDHQRHQGTLRRSVILYFGDHDPDGLEIPHSAGRNIQKLMETYDTRFPFRIERIALTPEQIEQYAPPPFEAKITSARYAKYVEAHGEDAWELDALEPTVLRDLITENVNSYFDRGIYNEHRNEVQRLRKALAARIAAPDWAARALAEEV